MSHTPDTDDTSTLGGRIRYARVQKGYTQLEFGERVRELVPTKKKAQYPLSAQRVVSKWERNLQEPEGAYLRAISTVVERSTRWLIGNNEKNGNLPKPVRRLIAIFKQLQDALPGLLDLLSNLDHSSLRAAAAKSAARPRSPNGALPHAAQDLADTAARRRPSAKKKTDEQKPKKKRGRGQ